MQAIIRCPKCNSINVKKGGYPISWSDKPLMCNDCGHRFSFEEVEG
ncbi:hypothetical protein ES703_27438 [subsurface metagenome]